MKTITNLEVLPAQDSTTLTTAESWHTVRSLVGELRELGRRASHISLLIGAELLRLKAELKVTQGGNRRSKPQTAVLNWETIVTEETGLSMDTCQRCMKLAVEARRRHPDLLDADLLDTSFAALPAPRQDELLTHLRQVADGRTMSQMWFDFGLCKNGPQPPPPGGKSAKNGMKGGATNRSSTDDLSLEDRLEQARKDGNTVIDIYTAGMWKELETDELSHLSQRLDGWIETIRTIIAARTVAERAVATRRRKGLPTA